jgi:hypothetical protein
MLREHPAELDGDIALLGELEQRCRIRAELGVCPARQRLERNCRPRPKIDDRLEQDFDGVCRSISSCNNSLPRMRLCG